MKSISLQFLADTGQLPWNNNLVFLLPKKYNQTEDLSQSYLNTRYSATQLNVQP